MLLAEGTGSGELVTVSYGPHPGGLSPQWMDNIAFALLLVVAEFLRLENHGDSLERAGAKASCTDEITVWTQIAYHHRLVEYGTSLTKA